MDAFCIDEILLQASGRVTFLFTQYDAVDDLFYREWCNASFYRPVEALVPLRSKPWRRSSEFCTSLGPRLYALSACFRSNDVNLDSRRCPERREKFTVVHLETTCPVYEISKSLVFYLRVPVSSTD